MADVERILIVGGGIAGLSVANALHRRGFTPELVERCTTWPTIGAGINLPANGVRVLRALRLGEVIARAAAVVRRWGFYDQQGSLLCETDLEDLWRDVGPSMAMTRIRLHEALLTGAMVPHRLGTALTSLAQDADQVRVGFSDGTSGSRTRWSWRKSSTQRTASDPLSIPMSKGASPGPIGFRRKVAPPQAPGFCRLRFATPRCENTEIRCFASAIGRSFRSRSRLPSGRHGYAMTFARGLSRRRSASRYPCSADQALKMSGRYPFNRTQVGKSGSRLQKVSFWHARKERIGRRWSRWPGASGRLDLLYGLRPKFEFRGRARGANRRQPPGNSTDCSNLRCRIRRLQRVSCTLSNRGSGRPRTCDGRGRVEFGR
jgi:hypothetical protein